MVRASISHQARVWCVVAAISSAVVQLVALQAPRDRISSAIVGAVFDHEVRAGDTLRSLGARFGVDAATIAADTGIRVGAALTPGQILRIDARHVVPAAVPPSSLVINVPQRMLFYSDDHGHYSAYPVAVGRPDWPTPLGAFTIIEKEEHPIWDVPRSIQEEMRREGKRVLAVVPPGPENPLGDHFLRLSFPSVGLHGTPVASSIYSFATHGCIRLHPDDITALFPHVDVGSAGRIVYEPVLLARTEEGIFLEVHRDVYRRAPSDSVAFVHEVADAAGLCAEIDWRLVDEVVKRRHGTPRPVSTRRQSSAMNLN
jgi:L,D-transpeptidase ErfK/SrfK